MTLNIQIEVPMTDTDQVSRAIAQIKAAMPGIRLIGFHWFDPSGGPVATFDGDAPWTPAPRIEGAPAPGNASHVAPEVKLPQSSIDAVDDTAGLTPASPCQDVRVDVSEAISDDALRVAAQPKLFKHKAAIKATLKDRFGVDAISKVPVDQRPAFVAYCAGLEQ